MRFMRTTLPSWQEDNRQCLRKMFSEEIHEKFDWAEKISKNRNTAAGTLMDWEIVMAEGLRKLITEENGKNWQRVEKTALILKENRKALNRIEHSNANARTILENLLLKLQWK